MKKEILKGLGGLLLLPLVLLATPFVIVWFMGRITWSLFSSEDSEADLRDLL